jgi:broad specificity phosphatase PhoE
MQGQGDYALSQQGVIDTQHARAHIETWGMRVIATSDLRRAIETGNLLGADETAIRDPRLRERDAGRWTGMTRAQMAAETGRDLADGWRPDDFEPLNTVVERLHASITDLLAQGLTGIVITHGAAMRAYDQAHGGTGGKFPNLTGLALDAHGHRLGRVHPLPPS